MRFAVDLVVVRVERGVVQGWGSVCGVLCGLGELRLSRGAERCVSTPASMTRAAGDSPGKTGSGALGVRRVCVHRLCRGRGCEVVLDSASRVCCGGIASVGSGAPRSRLRDSISPGLISRLARYN
jgi:hypothetical protein